MILFLQYSQLRIYSMSFPVSIIVCYTVSDYLFLLTFLLCMILAVNAYIVLCVHSSIILCDFVLVYSLLCIDWICLLARKMFLVF